jgi:hypothetical protein
MARMLGQGLEYLDFIPDAQKAHSEIHSYSIKRANRSNLKNPKRIEYIIPITIIFKNFNIPASR